MKSDVPWRWMGDVLVEDAGHRNVVLMAHDNRLHTRGEGGRVVPLEPDSRLGRLLRAAPQLLALARHLALGRVTLSGEDRLSAAALVREVEGKPAPKEVPATQPPEDSGQALVDAIRGGRVKGVEWTPNVMRFGCACRLCGHATRHGAYLQHDYEHRIAVCQGCWEYWGGGAS